MFRKDDCLSVRCLAQHYPVVSVLALLGNLIASVCAFRARMTVRYED